MTAFGAVILLAGGVRDPFNWGYVAVVAALTLYGMLGIGQDLARERFAPPSPGADRLSLRIVRLAALAHLVVALVDSRFGWTSVPPLPRGLALAGFAACFLLVMRAMLTNRFFSAVVRIQSDRGHHVVDRGPYAHVRHPGYAGMIPLVPLSALALGSWLALPVALVYSALILRRVVFEDGFLRDNLSGYAEYAGRVPYRLLPRVR
ncbi:MAG TPA: isoprenylcysteine carboxylmethyltransferase family protein [Vicinamibacterales bacterium]|nr:isoprenylcysteine carboxylmethyltransferase family protein [Vicinamibacterales bacterium]